MISIGRIESALGTARAELLSACPTCDHWESELPPSAFATASAVVALALAEGASSSTGLQNYEAEITKGQEWLAQHANTDGGWGDTPLSPSNALTTALVWAAFGASFSNEDKYADSLKQAETWLRTHSGVPAPAGDLTVEFLQSAFSALHGTDQTLAVPVLTACVLTGRLDAETAWKKIPHFPFEIASLPRSWHRFLSLPCASHGLSSMLAVGLAHQGQAGFPVKLFTESSRPKALTLLDKIQPSSGGFLESVPLTSFVVMGLSGIGKADKVAAMKGLAFVRRSQRQDGSWPIDTNLDTRLTTLAVSALLLTGERMPVQDLQDWILDQQFGEIHPSTNAAPGGWSWTHLPGGVPDAKDTAESLLVLKGISRWLPVPKNAKRYFSGKAGVRWLLNLQNSDGGVSTFVRSRSKLSVDGSSPDVTAHAIRAWLVWGGDFPILKKQINGALGKALNYLRATQKPDGSWTSLWYGSGRKPEEDNFTCGTTRVVLALNAMKTSGIQGTEDLTRRAVEWLVKTQLPDGGWASGNGGIASVEETAWAVECLANNADGVANGADALNRGVEWLVSRVESGQWKTASPVGFHFARVGYYEPMFPLVFTVSALARVRNQFKPTEKP